MSLAAFIPILGPLIDKLVERIPDPNERAKERVRLETSLLEAATAQQAQQAEINKIEAASPSVFVAGWRPAIGWVCGAGLAWVFVLNPVVIWGLALAHSTVTPPKLDVDYLLELVLAMLGLGGLRTFEKMKGVASR